MRGLRIDRIVEICDNEVSVYEGGGASDARHPDVGVELNKPAIVEMERVYPYDNPDATPAERAKYDKVRWRGSLRCARVRGDVMRAVTCRRSRSTRRAR